MSSVNSHPDATSLKKRRRPPLACEQCRKRKVRCDRLQPCNHCSKSGDSTCTYAAAHTPKRTGKIQPQQLVGTSTESSPIPVPSSSSANQTASTAAHEEIAFGFARPLAPSSSSLQGSTHRSSAAATTDVDKLLARVNELEKRLSNTIHLDSPKGDSSYNGFSFPEATVTIKGSISKTRYFGQSHWMNGAALFPFELKILGQAETEQSDLFQTLNKCKILARRIKETRLKPLSSTNLGHNIPPRELADSLVENYLRTFEGVFRILHIPTFRAEYERYWQNPAAANVPQVIMLQLCMALGSAIKEDALDLKPMAIQWVYEAQLWTMLPPEKSQLTLSGMQIMCLLTLAKSTLGPGQDLTWVFAGALMRKAMYMGLHRDPKHLTEMTRYRAEMHRRLWATIMELNLQFSFESGGAPLISEFDYDTQPPANYNDEELTDEPDDPSSSPQHSIDFPTQSTVQLALFESLPLRLKLLKYINDFRSRESYDYTLQLSAELTKAAREFSQKTSTLIGKKSTSSNSGAAPINQFHVLTGEMFVYRCFQTLHIPIISKSFNDPKYYFSRKMCVDSAIKLSSMWGWGEVPGGGEQKIGHNINIADFRRLSINGTGPYRNIPVQSIFVLSAELTHAAELVAQYKNGSGTTGAGLLPVMDSSDIRRILDGCLQWTVERIRAGETSPKGPAFLSACIAHADAVGANLDEKGRRDMVLQRTADSAALCWEVLNEIANVDGSNSAQTINGEMPTLGIDMEVMDMGWHSGWDWDDVDGAADMAWRPLWWQMQAPIPETNIPNIFTGQT